MPDKPTIMEQLQEVFPLNDYEWRVTNENWNGTVVSVVPYVKARAIQNRLDKVMGPEKWKAEYRPVASGGFICRLSIEDPAWKREEGESLRWLSKEDGASNTAVEPVKGGISNALKRAGNAWGIGRHLYRLKLEKVTLKPRGDNGHKVKNGANKGNWLNWDAPTLPDWAVAGENKKPEKKVEPTPPNAERDAVDEALGKRAIDEFRNAVATRLTKARATLDDNKKGKLIELLCGSQAIADLCKKTACDVPISAEFLMKPDHAAWTTLAQALNSLKMDQFRKLLAAASA